MREGVRRGEGAGEGTGWVRGWAERVRSGGPRESEGALTGRRVCDSTQRTPPWPPPTAPAPRWHGISSLLNPAVLASVASYGWHIAIKLAA